MRSDKLKWLFLLLGVLVGMILGGEMGLRYASTQEIELEKTLADNFVDSRIWAMERSKVNIWKAEKGKTEEIIADHEIFLRGEFLGLVQLHQSGRFPDKEAEMVESLKKAKTFMEARPKGFIDQSFISSNSVVDRVNDPESAVPAEKTEATSQLKQQLQDALDYVDSLEAPTRKPK